MDKLTKKQRGALKEISDLSSSRKQGYFLGIGSLVLMAAIILVFNTMGYSLQIIDPSNFALRSLMYITALVLAGFSGIKIMKAGQDSKKILALKQRNGITDDIIAAWKKGDVE